MTGPTYVELELTPTELRKFGLVTGGIVAVLFGLFFPWIVGAAIPLWPFIVGAVLVIWAVAAPRTLAPVHRRWMQLGLVLGRITTPLILGIVYFLLIAPIGLVMRLFGHDPMARRFDANAPSYRVNIKQVRKTHMEKPF